MGIYDRKMSVVMWLLYINWEAGYGQPSKIKDLVFRAMRECPWSKGTLPPNPTVLKIDLAMLAFGSLSELFDKRDMSRVYDVMIEKELRLHGELLSLGQHNPIRAIELPLDKDSSDDEDVNK